MKTVEEIKAAAAELSPDEQFELFRWWTQSDAFKVRQFEALKGALARGIRDLEEGKYSTYHSDELTALKEEVARSGREP